MRRSLPIFIALAALALAGCGTPEQKLIGKWKGEVHLSAAAQATPMGTAMRGMSSMLDPQLDLKPDHTFALYLAVLPVEGTWSYDGKSLTLQPKSYGGVEPEKVKRSMEKGAKRWAKERPMGSESAPNPGDPIKVQISEDWRTLEIKGELSGMPNLGNMVFKKV